MGEYEKLAIEFLEGCNAKMTIKYMGIKNNELWGEHENRNFYKWTIKTPRGQMSGEFWDSIHNTRYGKQPTEYDILSCLQKYDVGTIDDFIFEFGYTFNSWKDVKRVEKIYKACKKEYKNICRCFTAEQIEKLAEIQ